MLLRPVAICAAALVAGCASSEPRVTSAPAPEPRLASTAAPAPTARPEHAATAPVARPGGLPAPRPAATADFAAWEAGFRRRALAAGISPATLDAAFAGVEPNARVLELDSRQPEFTRPIWEYLDSAVSDSRISRGRELARRKAAALRDIEARYGVDAEVPVAIWGMESAYGANYGDIPVVESLATLAWDGRRREFGEEQLLAALRILQNGDVTPSRMVGSWAGAMGHTQFIPTSYLDYAVDFTGDGRRDLWAPDALDALASTANYLSRFGWERGQPWGVEVSLPAGFDYGLADETARPLADWRARGVSGLGGRAIPEAGPAKLLLPAGAEGPAFLTFRNFDVVKRYNNATSYALGVGHLSDRIAGGGPFAQGWPRDDRPLSRTEKEEMQRRLSALGFDTDGADGVVGPNTRAAIRAYQAARNRPADGYDSAELLERLRAETGG